MTKQKQPELVVPDSAPIVEPVSTSTPDEKSILAPKVKVKKPMSETQKANLEKGRLARDANRKKRAEEKESYIKQLHDKKAANIIKEQLKLKQIIIGSDDEKESEEKEEEEPEPEPIIIKKKAPKKKKIIVLPESEDEVEEEIIYKKSKKPPTQEFPAHSNNVSRIVFF